ncbi:MFS transporter [Streptomyces sp. 4N509B]|uniref:MFS transporter n=1 Tax=Streptomyces sp. 4N509B TaxID=3457413 RepID=UPI003FD6365A
MSDATGVTTSETRSRDGRRGVRRRLRPAPALTGDARTLYWATLVNMTGTGMFLTSSALYFTQYVGFSASQVGVGLSLGGLIGLLAGVPVGVLADRRGPREIYCAALFVEAVLALGLIVAQSFWAFVVVTTLASLVASASGAARGPLIRSLATERPTEYRARIRAATNLGIAIGGAITSMALVTGDLRAYLVLMIGNAVSFAVCAGLVARLGHVPPVRAEKKARGTAVFGDRPYLAVSGLNLVMMVQYSVLPLALPLWVFSQTQLPPWFVGTLLPLNTILVASLQVRLSRGLGTPMLAARMMARSGVLLLLSFALITAVSPLPRWSGWLVLVMAVVIYTVGEIYFAAATYELAFSLAPAHAQGQYMGLYGVAGGLGRAVSPVVVSFLCLGLGTPGWLLVGAILLCAGWAAIPVVRWAEGRLA